MVKFIHFLNRYLKYVKIELATSWEIMEPSRQSPYANESINPATGLPMRGGVDAAGNSFGSSSNDDYHRRRSSCDDYHRSQAYQSMVNPTSSSYSSSSSYDPF